jgi:uncharacterized protein YbjT (DUF2867 family)
MHILVTGAYGFIGRQIVSALLAAGHSVICGARRHESAGSLCSLEFIACDFTLDTNVETWLPRLQNIDAVVNCVGILRERGVNRFDTVHHAAPVALFQACVQAGVNKVIQLSALGESADTAFIASKHAADEALMAMDVNWVIVRPSVVYTTRGSYGGTSLIRALASIPYILGVPGDGRQLLQPVTAEDLGYIVVAALERENCKHTLLEAVSPNIISFKDYLLTLRRWLGFSKPTIVMKVPLALVRPLALLGEWFGRGPLGMTMYRMLQRGNVASPGAYDHLVDVTGVTTSTVDEALAKEASFVQDRWHARLYFLRPLLRLSLAFIWIFSGFVGLLLPVETALGYGVELGLSASMTSALVMAVSILDLVLGVLLVFSWCIPWVGMLMLVSLLAYSLVLGLAEPALWLEPLGGLLKNLALLPAVLIMLVLQRIR